MSTHERKMPHINGIPANLSLEWKEDIIEFNGYSFVELHTDNSGRDLLTLWVDCDNRTERYITFSISDNDYTAYINRQTTLRQLIDNTKEIYCMETDFETYTYTRITEVPDNYKPSHDSFYFS